MPDVRLIDANALQRAFDDAHKDEPDFFCCNFLNNAGNPSTEWDCVDDILENAPTIDAQPVKRGHWIIEKEKLMYGKYKQIWALRCSECRKDPTKHIGGGLSNWWFQTPEFCPVCGADMRGDAE